MNNANASWANDPAFREGDLVWGRVVADISEYFRGKRIFLSSP
jgi:hypothetical protein